MKILGISAYYHDSAAVLINNGEIVAAVQEERFTRKKHEPNFPEKSVQYCLQSQGLSVADIDYFVFYDKPLVKFDRLLKTYLAFAPMGFKSFRRAIPLWISEKLFQKSSLINEFKELFNNFDISGKLLFSEHHLSHAASAFYPSPFEESVVLTMDGVGEWTTTSVAVGRGNDLQIQKEIHFPHSIGLLYSAFTYYLGFKVNSGEYKVMGLAPYGEPKYKELILDTLIDLKPDGTFRLDQSYFNYCTGLTMTNSKFDELFGGKPRISEDELSQKHMDIAASIQSVTEEIILRITSNLYDEYGIDNLCLAGGVALNCVANGKILKQAKFKNIWIQPASGDAGGALGAALIGHYLYKENKRLFKGNSDSMKGSYLGPAYEQHDIEKRLDNIDAKYSILKEEGLVTVVAEHLASGKAVGWHQGRMEFGPRSLGSRSILGDPRSPDMQKILNLKVKYRESFRPFAPAIMINKVSEWFELDVKSPYMLLVADILPKHRKEMSSDQSKLFGIEKLNVTRSSIPAVTHIDYSARIQTVDKNTNPMFYKLIEEFNTLTNCPVLVNTSFNIRSEPIVCSPEDAFNCFMGTELDVLVVGNCILLKHEQSVKPYSGYRQKFVKD